MYKYYLIGWLIIVFCYACETSLPPVEDNFSDQVRINQIGYYPNAVKKFFVIDDEATKFALVNEAMESVFEGELEATEYWQLSDEKARMGDISTFNQTGTFRIYVQGLGYSYPFEIKSNIYSAPLTASLKSFYYQRMSTALPEKHAGQWHRLAAHPDNALPFHPSSGKSGGNYASPGGWYDAGDYNKYTVNGAFSTGQLLALYEVYPDLIQDNALNIPESGNGKSDLLDEIRYELDWLLTMQDSDGGCFHKITTEKFEDMVMPDKAVSQRYVVGKGTAATLTFAACMAKAYRSYIDIDPDFANRCMAAAERAWDWAIENPEVIYRNPDDIHTGEYGDDDFEDEWYWAATEIYSSNESAAPLGWLLGNPPFIRFETGGSWKKFMTNMGVFTLMEVQPNLPNNYRESLKSALIRVANELVLKIERQPYRQPIKSFQWGSNSDIMNASMILAYAYKQTLDQKYVHAIQEGTDYIFGKNATGYSFLTGFGDQPPQRIHHRQSQADGIDEPIPGFLVGGPNLSKQDVKDGTKYPKNAPAMKCYVDQVESYASNEVCLNWNAPLTFVLGFLESNQK